MSAGTGPPPLRVEQALRLLPDVDALTPLRAFLVAASRARPAAEPYRTVGKRYLPASNLQELVPRAIARVTEHLTALYADAVEALQAEQRGDLSAVVRALVRAGEREERVNREAQAHVWYDHALRIAEELHDRRPEVEALIRLGQLETARGQLERGARWYQRSLALAEAERDLLGAAQACRGLGDVALAYGQWQGAESWYTRGLRYSSDDRRVAGLLYLGLWDVARQRDDADAAADRLQRARAVFEEIGDAEGIARSLDAAGVMERRRKQYAAALNLHREALARLQRAGGHPSLEMSIRLNLCDLFLVWDRLPDAEDEVRRAEEAAITFNATRQLARLYVIMGKVLGRQGDETGFVFFEKAVELCRGIEPAPRLEAEVYVAYGRFRLEMGAHEEGHAYLERAHEILLAVDDVAGAARVERELRQLPPP